MEFENKEERKLFNPRSNAEVKTEMEQKGFTFLGMESLTQFKFTPEAKFVAEQFRTAEEVKKQYEDSYEGKVEVEWVLEEGLSQHQTAILLFGRPRDYK